MAWDVWNRCIDFLACLLRHGPCEVGVVQTPWVFSNMVGLQATDPLVNWTENIRFNEKVCCLEVGDRW